MNYPDTQRTGALAEMRVEALFVEWGWVTGTDRIDVGYDLCVQPDKNTFHGHRFLVQVKGTATRKKGSVVAPVAKSRLRDYHSNPTPVFIIRSTQDGSLFWIHAQEWTRANTARLAGNGYSSIKLSQQNNLLDREAFTKKLSELFAPLATRAESLVELAADRGAYLSGIDKRLNVQVGTEAGQTTYRFSAAGEDVTIPLELMPADPVQGVQSLTDAIHFGLPVSVDLEQIRVTGSPLFEALNMDRSTPAKLEIAPSVNRRGSVTLQPGTKFNLLSSEVQVTANLYFGSEGAAITTGNEGGAFFLDIRAFRDSGRPRPTQINMGLRRDEFLGRPLRDHSALAHVGKWAEEALTQNGLSLIAHFGGRQVAKWQRQNLEPDHRNFLILMGLVCKLHQIARALGSDIEFNPDAEITQSDATSIQLAYKLLKGEAVRIGTPHISVQCDTADVESLDGLYALRTALHLSHGDESVGNIPVLIELFDYRMEFDEELKVQHFYRECASKAYMKFDESRAATSS